MLHKNPIEPSQKAGRGTILIADDDPLVVELLSTALRTSGWSTVHARTGLDVLKIVGTNNLVDALILDMRMPEKDGYEVCLELFRRGINLPTLVITGCVGDMEPLNFLNVTRTLQKPVTLGQLLEFVEQAVPQTTPQAALQN